MNRLFLVVVLVAAVYATAQDRTITVREVDVVPLGADIRIETDGGCTFSPRVAIIAPSVEPVVQHSQWAFNGARCTAVKSAIAQAAKNDLGIGTGAAP